MSFMKIKLVSVYKNHFEKYNIRIETCFSFLIHCWPIRTHKCYTRKIPKKIQKCNFADFTRDFLIILIMMESSMDEKCRKNYTLLSPTRKRRL